MCAHLFAGGPAARPSPGRPAAAHDSCQPRRNARPVCHAGELPAGERSRRHTPGSRHATGCQPHVLSSVPEAPSPPPLHCSRRRTSGPWLCGRKGLSTRRSGPTPPTSCTRSGGGAPRSRVRACGGGGGEQHVWHAARVQQQTAQCSSLVRPILRPSFCPPRPLLVCAGSWAELELDTRAEAEQGETLVWLSHLRRWLACSGSASSAAAWRLVLAALMRGGAQLSAAGRAAS